MSECTQNAPSEAKKLWGGAQPPSQTPLPLGGGWVWGHPLPKPNSLGACGASITRAFGARPWPPNENPGSASVTPWFLLCRISKKHGEYNVWIQGHHYLGYQPYSIDKLYMLQQLTADLTTPWTSAAAVWMESWNACWVTCLAYPNSPLLFKTRRMAIANKTCVSGKN